LRDAATNASVKAIIVTWSAEVFCSGGDIRSMPTDADRIRVRLGELHEIVRILYAGPKPTVAAVEGAAFGAGLSIMAACDVVIAGEGTRFGCTFGRVGLAGDTGIHATLPNRVGARSARQILLGSEIVLLPDAASMGLVDRVVSSGHALPGAIEVAQQWMASAPLALAATKRLLAPAFDVALSEEMEEQIRLFASSDFEEGRRSFLERRSPQFSGAVESDGG
jgi:enoyl-CoA hydratase/carnithine racemase